MRPQTSESRISAAIAVAPALQKSTSWIPGPGLKAYPAASGPWPAIYPNVKIFRSPSRCKNTPQACCPACCAACHTSPHLAQRFEAPDILDLVQVTQVRREVGGRARQQPDAGRSHHRRRPAGAGTHARARQGVSARRRPAGLGAEYAREPHRPTVLGCGGPGVKGAPVPWPGSHLC